MLFTLDYTLAKQRLTTKHIKTRELLRTKEWLMKERKRKGKRKGNNKLPLLKGTVSRYKPK